MTETLNLKRTEPTNKYEAALLRHKWPWVQTNTLDPTGTPNPRNGIPDHLAPHSHHGQSTHYAVQGDVQFTRLNTGITYELSNTPGSRRHDHVPANTTYSETSKTGCVFVEGHAHLSPRTAERFLARGTIRVVAGGNLVLPDEATLRTWLRQVHFDPRGKARPDRAKGEVPILDSSSTDPVMPANVHRALARWFEKEWGRRAELGILRQRMRARAMTTEMIERWLDDPHRMRSWAIRYQLRRRRLERLLNGSGTGRTRGPCANVGRRPGPSTI